MRNARIIVRGRGRRSILNAGAHRAALENVAAYKTHNERSAATTISPIYVDPALGRAETAARRAQSHGIEADAIEARAEDVLEGEVVDAVVANVDNAGAIVKLLAAAEARRIPALGQLVVELPSTRALGVRFAHPADDVHLRKTMAFFRGLEAVTARSGAAAIFGDEARGRASLVEPFLRESFAAHTSAELSRLTAGIAPEHSPLDITDGRRSMPLLVVERPIFGEPTEVVLAAVESPDVPLRRGAVFFVAEVTPAGLRLHEARRRQIDGKFSVTPRRAVDERRVLAMRERPSALVDALGARASASEKHSLELLLGVAATAFAGALSNSSSAAARAAVEALRMDTLSSTSPVLTTD